MARWSVPSIPVIGREMDSVCFLSCISLTVTLVVFNTTFVLLYFRSLPQFWTYVDISHIYISFCMDVYAE
jgi:hypothetical protein